MKKRFFYVFDEHTDYVRECQKIGMKPIENNAFIENFEYDGTKYTVLSCNECYSGWEITVMALPEMSYSDLFDILMNSRFYDEIVGSIGIILKKHLDEFLRHLSSESLNNKRIKKVKKMIKKEISERNSNVKGMTELLNLC